MKLENANSFIERGNPPPANAGFLGVDLDFSDASVVAIPVPWDVTTSYGKGTSKGPQAIISASHQMDAEDSYFGKIYRAGISFLEVSKAIEDLNKVTSTIPRENITKINQACAEVNKYVYEEAQKILAQKKLPCVVGGDHAAPFGLIQALAENYADGFSIVHLDAHHDLRDAYEGFEHSHASIHYNTMTQLPQIKFLTQVGIRDYSSTEKEFMIALAKQKRGACFYSRELFARQASGVSFEKICDDIFSTIPTENIYISFDIDALDPSYCPSTGTPVPGGWSFEQACYFLEKISRLGKNIIGFDLCEVAPGPTEWDANVGARLFYKLCGTLLRSHKKV